MTCKIKTIPKIKYCIGTLKKTVSLEQRVKSKFASNQSKLEYKYTEIAKIKCGIKTVSGNIIRDGIAINDGASHLFVMRYRENMTQELFLNYNLYRYDILDVTNVNEDNKWLEVRAKKVGLIQLEGSK